MQQWTNSSNSNPPSGSCHVLHTVLSTFLVLFHVMQQHCEMAAVIASISQIPKLKQKGPNGVPKQVVQPGSQTPGLGKS